MHAFIFFIHFSLAMGPLLLLVVMLGMVASAAVRYDVPAGDLNNYLNVNLINFNANDFLNLLGGIHSILIIFLCYLFDIFPAISTTISIPSIFTISSNETAQIHCTTPIPAFQIASMHFIVFYFIYLKSKRCTGQ